MTTPEKPDPWAGMTREERLAAMPPFKKRHKPEPQPEPKAVVSLALSNPDVPLERQRERLSEAQKRLVEDEDRRLKELKEQKRHERLLMERQAAIDFHMEQKLANEEWERRYRDDPGVKLSNEIWAVEIKLQREAERRQRQQDLAFRADTRAIIAESIGKNDD